MATITVRLDDNLKNNFAKTCDELGMDMTTAFTIFAKKVSREKKIPFEVSYDPFYSESNMNYLKQSMEKPLTVLELTTPGWPQTILLYLCLLSSGIKTSTSAHRPPFLSSIPLTLDPGAYTLV